MAKRSARRRPASIRTKSKAEHRIFLSHATIDKWVAVVLTQKLEAVGAVVFRDDRDIRGGDDIPDEIVAQINRCTEMVVLLTPNSIGRQWVMLEVGMALGSKRRIVPILYHVTVDPVPSMIRSKKAYNLNEVGAYIEEVAQRIRDRRK